VLEIVVVGRIGKVTLKRWSLLWRGRNGKSTFGHHRRLLGTYPRNMSQTP
jgi:hypothetical protein